VAVSLDISIIYARLNIHRRFDLRYGDAPATGEPRALVNGQWLPFTRLHSVKGLWGYLKTLFLEQEPALAAIARVNWGWALAAEVGTSIDTIERLDPRSTFFRYPSPEESQADAPKAAMAEAAEDEILEHMKQNPDRKQFVLLLENDEREVTRSYYYAGPALSEFSRVLKECADHFYGVHTALRVEVCHGA
jgi:hypothetical protein